MTTSTEINIFLPNFSVGGAQIVGANLANELVSQGKIVNLICVGSSKGNLYDFIDSKVNIYPLDCRRIRYSVFILFWFLLKSGLTKNPSISVIRSVNVAVGLISFVIPMAPILMREASTFERINAFPFVLKFATILLMRIAYSKAKAVVANSNATKFELIHHSVMKEDDPKLKVLNNPVLPKNFEQLACQRTPETIGDIATEFILVSIGRLDQGKNHKLLIDILLSVLKRRISASLIIVGEGELRHDLEDYCNTLGITESVYFLGHQRNIYPILKRSDLFILTSKWEGFGNVLVESMACGCPVLGLESTRGGAKEVIIKSKFGVLSPSDLPSEVAITVEDILKNKGFGEFEDKVFRADFVAKQYLECLLK